MRSNQLSYPAIWSLAGAKVLLKNEKRVKRPENFVLVNVFYELRYIFSSLTMVFCNLFCTFVAAKPNYLTSERLTKTLCENNN